ncbi:MAG: (Fe-S)-binding protein [Chloroflexota bacterium]
MADKTLASYYDETLKCVRCGLCQAVCPVFAVERSESAVARGKVQIVRAVLENRIGGDASVRERVFACLNCDACTANCPSGVAITEVVLAARAELRRTLGQPAVERLLLRDLLASPTCLELGGTALALYERSGLRWLAHKSRLLEAFPGEVAAKEGMLPGPAAARGARQTLPCVSTPAKKKRRVAYFLGCVTNVVYQQVARAVVDVLIRNDCEVVVAPDLRCCGMPHRNYGDTETAARLEGHNTARLNGLDVDAVVTDCATCGSTLRAYSGLRAPVYDVNAFLADQIGFAEPGEGSPLRVTYHDPCHLARGQNVRAAPRQVLQAIPGVKLVEMAEADRCCGGAGTFALMHHEVSMAILDRKIDNAAATRAEVVATACPACRMQLAHGLARLSRRQSNAEGPRRVIHPVELLAAAYAHAPRRVGQTERR